jgi:muramoyltetrapeptide carboxypeptidase
VENISNIGLNSNMKASIFYRWLFLWYDRKIMGKRLKSGDTIAVIAPSGSFKEVLSLKSAIEERLLAEFGLKAVYGKHCMEQDMLGSSSVGSRIADLHEAFSDQRVKAIICANGGYNSNELLPHIDWDLIRENPKPFIGSSDNTVLLNAIYAKTGMATYFGPNFYKFGMRLGLEYTLEFFKKCLMDDNPYVLFPAPEWSNDKWYKDQDNRMFAKSNGYQLCNPGHAKGIIIGGNLNSLNLLQGTEYMPSLADRILFIEDDDLAGEDCFGEFVRNLESLLQQPQAVSIKGVVVGRFPTKSKMTAEKLCFIFASKSSLKGIPIVLDADFGHCDPMFTFPIGGEAEIDARPGNIRIVISAK